MTHLALSLSNLAGHKPLSDVLKALLSQKQNGFSEHRILIFIIWIVETNSFVKIRNSFIIDCIKWISFVKPSQWEYLVLILITFRLITKDPYYLLIDETKDAKVELIVYEPLTIYHGMGHSMSRSMDPFW